ncbi:hypothetical protein [Thalassotalea sp. G20_0]|uniref:hypothetical protein n=1 Tax=Thalassotalea sp. G20_0 TaxID=2821093 RepID=UPI001ADB0B64|nr:hypothetical protein [Thalassotalea sp. G20_0]
MAEAKPRPGTLVVSYIALGKWQDIRDSGNGQMIGSGTGTILFATGSAAITLDALPDPDSAIVFSYVAQNDNEVTIRTTILALQNYNYPEWRVRTYAGGKIREVEATNVPKVQTFNGSTITAIAQASNLSHAPYNENITSPELTIDLLPLMDNVVLLPGSVVFEWNGETYFDRDGSLYKNLSTETNAGIQVGRVDYSGGLATLANYPAGTVNTATIQAAATIGVGFGIDAVAFRTPGAPIRQGSLQLTAVRVDNGDIITATADFNGEFDTAEVVGNIDVTTGWCELQFTDGANPIYVIPQSVRYNCVVETSLPLDAELIGLDPVRLPPDGKVPIYRAGDIVVISHTAATDAGTPIAGQVINLVRDHQAEIVVEDSSGALLASDQYTVDREAGTVTFADPLSLVDLGSNPLAAPFTIKDRVEHMSVLSDVQINGDLSIISPVPWDLPASETTVSSAVVYGDLQARVKNFFSQKVFSDCRGKARDHS